MVFIGLFSKLALTIFLAHYLRQIAIFRKFIKAEGTENGLAIFFIFHRIIEENRAHHLRQIAIFRKFIKGEGTENGLAIFWCSGKKNLPLN